MADSSHLGVVKVPRVFDSVKDVAEKVRFAGPRDGHLGKTIFLVGAGCSVTSGIPSAIKIAQHMTLEAEQRLLGQDHGNDFMAAYNNLVNRGRLTYAGGGATDPNGDVDWYQVYDEMFRRHYAVPDDTRELFDAIIQKAGGRINWAHLCLGELASRKFISTVLTTNFDQLVLAGMVRAGILPVVCDGLESLNRIAGSPLHTQLIELHGSRHTYLLRNRPEDLIKVRQEAAGAIQKLLQPAANFVVVGYGGREDGVMDILIEAARIFRDKNIFWVQYSTKLDDLSPKAVELLGTSQNSGLLIGQDADVFFLELCRELGVGTPTALSDPLKLVRQLIENTSACGMTNPDICSEIEKAKSYSKHLTKALQDYVAGSVDPISEIRATRLSGDIERAYDLAEKALKELLSVDGEKQK
jgi:hypothetical protein